MDEWDSTWLARLIGVLSGKMNKIVSTVVACSFLSLRIQGADSVHSLSEGYFHDLV